MNGSMGHPYGKNIKLDPYLIPNTQINSKCIKEKWCINWNIVDYFMDSGCVRTF